MRKMIEHDPCLECGGVVERRARESAPDFRGRRWCSPICYINSHGVKEDEQHPPCANLACGGAVVRRLGEPAAKWRTRRCCSAICVAILAGDNRRDARVDNEPLLCPDVET